MLKIFEQIKEAAFKDELQKIATPMGFKKAVLLKSCTAKDLEKKASPREIDIGMAIANRARLQLQKGKIGSKAAERLLGEAKKLTHPVHGVIRSVPLGKPGTFTEGSKRRELIESVINKAQSSTRESHNIRGEIVRGKKLYNPNKNIESLMPRRSSVSKMPQLAGLTYA